MEAMTEAALLEALRAAMDAGEDDGGAMTADELTQKMECNIDTVRKRVKALIATGRAECVRVRRMRIDGLIQRVPAYRLIA